MVGEDIYFIWFGGDVDLDDILGFVDGLLCGINISGFVWKYVDIFLID